MRETLDLIHMICKVRRRGVFASGIFLSRNREATSGRQPVKNLPVGSYRSFTPVRPYCLLRAFPPVGPGRNLQMLSSLCEPLVLV
jgi:hypothetical protein